METLGVPLASGREADVFALTDGRVLRRYREDADASHEAGYQDYVAGLGYPVPRVYAVDGRDMVLERVPGPCMREALVSGEVDLADGAAILADLHVRLHALPPRYARDPDARVLHRDLHPENVIMSPRGPVVIDWHNVAEGPPDLDVAMTAVILAQVAVDTTHEHTVPARMLLDAFLRRAPGDAGRLLHLAAEGRRGDPHLTPAEHALLGDAVALVTAGLAG